MNKSLQTTKKERPKILICLFRFPYPAIDGTRYKILDNVINGLAQDFELEFFISTTEPYTQDQVDYLDRNFGKVHVFYKSKFQMLLGAVVTMFTKLPFQARAFLHSDARTWLDMYVHDYDAFYVHEIRLTQYFIHFADVVKKKILVDFNDAISLNYNQLIKTAGFLERLFYTFEGNRVRRYEQRVLRSFFHFNIVSEYDREYLMHSLGNTQTDFSCIHHGITIPELPISVVDTSEKIFFIGKLDYVSNREALTFFIDNIWSDLRKQVPSIQLFVIGQGDLGMKYRTIPGVTFTGFVPDLVQVIKDCSLLVVPIRSAGGTPSKILDAMSFGLPVITTPIAVAGIPGVQDGINACIVSEQEIDKWISGIKKLLQDSSYRQQIGQNARDFIIKNYSSETSRQEFSNRFHGLTN